MRTVYDQSQDLNGQELHRITSLYGLPAFVKNAEADRLYGDDKTDPHMFADVSQRRWPCHTAPATWTSAAFFFEKAASMPKALADRIEARLREASRFFGIGEDVDQLSEKIARAAISDESQLPDDAFAIVMTYEDDRKVRKYPMRSALETQKAANYLMQYRDQFIFDDRRRIADHVLEKANHFGANLGELREPMEKMSGLGACSSSDAAALVRSRINALGHPADGQPIQVELEKLARRIEDHPGSIQHHTTLTKIAETIDQLDRDQSLIRGYGTVLERPEDVLFGVTKEAVAEVSNEIIGSNLTGNFYKRADLERLSVTQLGEALGGDFAEAISTANAWVDTEKLAEILPTLPRTDMEIFDAVAAESGVAPFATKQAEAVAVSQPILRQMAASHPPGVEGSLWNHLN